MKTVEPATETEHEHDSDAFINNARTAGLRTLLQLHVLLQFLDPAQPLDAGTISREKNIPAGDVNNGFSALVSLGLLARDPSISRPVCYLPTAKGLRTLNLILHGTPEAPED